MKLFAWSINHGNNNIEDRFIIADDLEEAKSLAFDIISTTNNLHCWAIADITHASEPHWRKDWE